MLPPLPEGPGLVFVLSGPAGSGKTTLCDLLLAEAPRARRLVTCTSRAPRPGERDGVDYHFLSAAAFETALAAGEFFEHALVHGNHYGSRARDARALLEQRFDVLLNIDVQGAATLRAKAAADPALAGKLVDIFLYPPPVAQLRERLRKRAQDDNEEIERRLRNAAVEVARWGEFGYLLPSGTREEDVQRLRAIYIAERLRERPGLALAAWP
jgi:guanylate kinase